MAQMIGHEIKDLIAQVEMVTAKYAQLVSPTLEPGSLIRVSAPVIAAALPNMGIDKPCMDLEAEIKPGDSIKMDVSSDEGDRTRFIVRKIHAIRRDRINGFYLVGFGMVINTTEYAGILVRSRELNRDVVFDLEQTIIPSGYKVKIGTTVGFEVFSSADPFINIDCQDFTPVAARVYSADVISDNFPYYRDVVGRVIKNEILDTYVIRFTGDAHLVREILPPTCELPVFEGAAHGGVAPLTQLVGELVTCFICLKSPYFGAASGFEVIKISCAPDLFAVPNTERLNTWEIKIHDHSYRGSIATRIYQESQAHTNYNGDLAEIVHTLFLFCIENMETSQFQRFTEMFPHCIEVLIKDSGLEKILDSGAAAYDQDQS